MRSLAEMSSIFLGVTASWRAQSSFERLECVISAVCVANGPTFSQYVYLPSWYDEKKGTGKSDQPEVGWVLWSQRDLDGVLGLTDR